MPESHSAGSKRPRGRYSRLICLACRERRIRCELPDDVEVPSPGELRTIQTPCYRCKRLDIPCVIRQTVLGRPGSDKTSSTAGKLGLASADNVASGTIVELPSRIATRPMKAAVQNATQSVSTSVSTETSPDSANDLSSSHGGSLSEESDMTDGSLDASIFYGSSLPLQAERRNTNPANNQRLLSLPAYLTCTCSESGNGYTASRSRNGRDYTASANVHRSPEPTKGLALSPLKVSSGELRGLEYFCTRAAPDLGMYFDADFWSSLLVQASVAEPVLGHAMAAMGLYAKQREFEKSGNADMLLTESAVVEEGPSISVHSLGQSTYRNDPVGLMSYSKAAGLLAKHIASSPKQTDTVLLACVLFICIEFLRDDEEAALRHFKGGMTIIMNTAVPFGSSSGSNTMPENISNGILPFFNRLELLYALFGNDASWEYPITLQATIPTAFSSIVQARDSIVHLMNLGLRFIRKVHEQKYELSPVPSTTLEEQTTLTNQLQLWRTRFSEYRRKHLLSLTPSERYASNVLEIQYLIAYTWISTSTTPLECAHDEHTAAYTEAVSLAEQLSVIAGMHTAQRSRYSNTFTLDVEIVGPIHMVSIKCRDPLVRRRAIAVLRSTRRQEGMWDSMMYATLAERVMAIEEAGMVAGEMPSEEARVHHSHFVPSEFDADSSSRLISFYMKPDGVYGPWSVRHEQVSIV